MSIPANRRSRLRSVALALCIAAGASLLDGKAAAAIETGARIADEVALARSLETYGHATGAAQALLLAGRIWRGLGDIDDSERVIAAALAQSPGDAELRIGAKAIRSAADKAPIARSRPSLIDAHGEVEARISTGAGPTRVQVVGSRAQPVRMVVRDRAGIELCRRTGEDGEAECRWVAGWAGEVVTEIHNLGGEPMAVWTLLRSEDTLPRKQEVKWR